MNEPRRDPKGEWEAGRTFNHPGVIAGGRFVLVVGIIEVVVAIAALYHFFS